MIATVAGVATLLVGATTVFAELQGDLDRIWRAPAREKTSGVWTLLRSRLLSFGMILGIAFLLMVSLVMSAAISALGEVWAPFFGAWEVLAHAVNIVVGFAVTTLLFAMIYKFMPRADVGWRDVWVGVAFTALLFTVGRFLIGLYLQPLAHPPAAGLATGDRRDGVLPARGGCQGPASRSEFFLCGAALNRALTVPH